LAPDRAETLPAHLEIDDCYFEGCGAAAAHLEAREVLLCRTTFCGNHRDFPYNEAGGQLIIDYKADNIRLKSCFVYGGAVAERTILVARGDGTRVAVAVVLGSVGIEAAGSGITVEDTVVTANSHEGIHLNGARRVVITGQRTRITGNNMARREGNASTHNVSITTTAPNARLNALSRDILFRDITCENGVVVWTNGSLPRFQLDGLQVIGCDLSGPDSRGVAVAQNPDGTSVRGDGWLIAGNTESM
jgi:hypothetical protein